MAEYIPWNSQRLEVWRQKHASGEVIDLEGRSTHYVQGGTGKPLIMVHGFNMDLYTWVNNIDFLAEHFTVYALDLWGLGYSTRQQLDWGFPLYAEQLRLFMDAMELETAHLMGHSMGGGSIVKFAVQHPERVRSLILVDSVGLSFKMHPRSYLFRLPILPEIILGINSDNIRRKNLADLWVHDPERITDEIFNEFCQFQKVQNTTRILLTILRKDIFRKLEDEFDQVGQLDIPTLVTWGKHDGVVPLEVGQRMPRMIQRSTMKIFEDSSHMPNFEEPDEFNQLVADWLSEVESKKSTGDN